MFSSRLLQPADVCLEAWSSICKVNNHSPHGLVDDGARVGQLYDVLVGDSSGRVPRESVHLRQQLGLRLRVPRQGGDGKCQRRRRCLIPYTPQVQLLSSTK
jgi:hypothetical protein